MIWSIWGHHQRRKLDCTFHEWMAGGEEHENKRWRAFHNKRRTAWFDKLYPGYAPLKFKLSEDDRAIA